MGRDRAIRESLHWDMWGRCSICQQLAAPCISESCPETDNITVLKFFVKHKRQKSAGRPKGIVQLAGSKEHTQFGHVVPMVDRALLVAILEEHVFKSTTELLYHQ